MDIINEGSEHELFLWEGQMRLFGETAESLPPKIRLYETSKSKNEVITHRFVVTGHMYDLEFNMSFRFHKAFETEEYANKFFDAFKLRYPCSVMELRENKLSTLREYF